MQQGSNDRVSVSCVAFDVIARPCSAVDALLVQAHANQTGVFIWHPTLHILYKQIEICFFINTIVVPLGSTRGQPAPTSAVISVHLSLHQYVSVIKRIMYMMLYCVLCRDAVPPYTFLPAGRRTVGKILATHTVRGAKRCRRYRNSLQSVCPYRMIRFPWQPTSRLATSVC